MRYRKFAAQNIFNGYEVLPYHTLITNEEGIVESVVPTDLNDTGVEKLDGFLCPGFINAHCHLELSHMKGAIPERTGLVDFVYKVITERQAEKEVMLQAIATAEKEMWDNGIIAVGDICNNPITLYQKLKKNLYYHNFIEVSGFLPSIIDERFKKSVDLFRAFGDFYPVPAVSNSLAPHAPYSVNLALLRFINSYPGNHIVTMHNQETEDENALYRDKTGGFMRLYEKLNIDPGFFNPPGTSSLQACLPYFLSQQKLILVHNVCTSQEDMAYIGSHDVPMLYFCLCPNANVYISGLMPPVDLIIQSKQKIVLGTDSLASNHELNTLSEINTLKKHFPHLSYEQMLKWATINGAEALEIEERFGSFDRGKQPGIVHINPSFTKAKRLL